MEKTVYYGSAETSNVSTMLRTVHTLLIDANGVVQDSVRLGVTHPYMQYDDRTLPLEHSIEHLDYTVVRPKNTPDNPVTVALIGGLHADEEQAPIIAATLFENQSFPRLEAWNTHIAAAMLGRREWVRPFQVNETLDTVPQRERVRMKNGKEVRQGGVLGRKIDLNRQFPIPSDAHSWRDAFGAVVYPEAKLLLTMMKDNPNIQYVFSFHEDPEFGHKDHPKPGVEQLTRDGVYFYDMPHDARRDTDKAMVGEIKTTLGNALTEAGFTLFHGVDDPNDPALGYFADHGYIYQPLINTQGERTIDGTFESAVVELGRLGITNVDRAFSFEVPGGLAPQRKTQIIDIITNTFILPFLAKKGVV